MPDTATTAAELIDVHHLGTPRVIGAWLIDGVLVDPGPASCLEALLDGLAGRVPRALALTHIHLDHAGAAGTLASRFPELEVWVHERGARHLADPTRLLASAERLYGSDMQRLWGQVRPVPAERLRVLSGGESLGAFTVAYTPGHASHHVSYLHEPSRMAFTGDAAGVRISEGPVLAPTPPPDIDLGAWRASLQTIASWQPSALALTHFGAHADVAEHLRELGEWFDEAEAIAAGGDPRAFERSMRGRTRERSQPQTAALYERAMPPGQSYEGLARYLSRSP